MEPIPMMMIIDKSSSQCYLLGEKRWGWVPCVQHGIRCVEKWCLNYNGCTATRNCCRLSYKPN